MKNLKIIIIGQPNVGKSSLLNALVGSKVTVSNYPGTTVEITKARKKINGTEIEFVDTPGIYSISNRSEEERITEHALFEEDLDGVMVVADAMSLERSLYIVMQLLEAQIFVILVLNFIEEARKKGIKIDVKKLEKYLDAPVVSVNPLTKRGINKLEDTLLNIKKITGYGFMIKYDDHIEQAINKISDLAIGKLPKRFVGLRALEDDKNFYKYIKEKDLIKNVKNSIHDHPKIAEDISITRYGTASFIAGIVTGIDSLRKNKNIPDRFDNIFFHKFWGAFTTGIFFILVFAALLFLGNLIQTVFMDLSENILSSLGPKGHSIIKTTLIYGLNGLAAGISIALPYVFLFYLILGLLEDIGLLARFIVNAENFLRKIGLPGKSFIPLLLGLGCTAPATRATRILTSKKEQFSTASLFAFIPCSSRIAIIMGVVGFYGGVKVAFYVFTSSIVSGLIWALIMKKIINIKSEPLLLEIPPFRRPLIKNVLAKSWIRMKDFVYIVLPLLILGGIIYGILDTTGLTNGVLKPLSPITSWLGLPGVTIIPLVFGFLQKDLTGAMLLTVLGSNISLVLTPVQIYTFGVAATIGIPCIVALGMLISEFGFKKALFLTATSIGYGFLFAGLVWRVNLLIL